MQKRKCYKCKLEKEIEDFKSKHGSPLGKDYICKACINQYNKFLRSKKEGTLQGQRKKYPDWVLLLRNRGNKKKIKSKISGDFLLELYETQNGKCFYSNIVMKTDLDTPNLKNISMDRLDSNLGYEPKKNILYNFVKPKKIFLPLQKTF